MDDCLIQALELVKAQASVRQMSEDEITSMVKKFASSLRSLDSSTQSQDEFQLPPDSAKSIKENSITCLECGKVCKMLSAKHLESHGLTAAEYKEKWGLKAKTSLIAKSLLRMRKKKMQEMKLWERRGKSAKTTKTKAKKV